MFGHYWFLNHEIKFQSFVCNGCHDLMMLRLNLSDIIIIVKNAVYCCVNCNVSKFDAIYLLENSGLDDRGYIYIMHFDIKNQVHNHPHYLIKSEKIETKNILIDQKNFKDLVIYLTRYVNCKPIKMINLYYHELREKIEKHERKKYLMVDDYMLHNQKK